MKLKDSIYLRFAFGYVVIIFPFTLIFFYFYFINYNYVNKLKSFSNLQIHPHILFLNSYINNLEEINSIIYSLSIKKIRFKQDVLQSTTIVPFSGNCNCHNNIKNFPLQNLIHQTEKEKLCYYNQQASLCKNFTINRINSFRKQENALFPLINTKIFSNLKEQFSQQHLILIPNLYSFNELIIRETLLLALTYFQIRINNIHNFLILYYQNNDNYYKKELIKEINLLWKLKKDNSFQEASLYLSAFENFFINDLFSGIRALEGKIEHKENLLNIIDILNQKIKQLDDIKLSKEREFTFHFNGIYEQINFYEQMYINFLIATLLSMIFGILLSYIIVKPILSSIRRLKTSIEKVKEGNFNISFDKIGSDEISELQLAFIKMSETLKQREEEIMKRNKELAEMQASLIQTSKLSAIGMLSTGIAHELNQPLMVINSYIDILKEEFKNNDKITEDINVLKKQIEKMKNIIFQLSDFSKSDLKTAVVNINHIIDNVLSFTTNYFAKNNISLIKDYTWDLPPLLINQSQIEQVILNILTNAVDAIKPKGKGNISIKTSIASSEEICITISDNGIGIPKEFIDKIFEPFFTTKQPGNGIGLGLYVSYKIISSYGGRINVKSKEKEGTEFNIFLPIKKLKTNYE